MLTQKQLVELLKVKMNGEPLRVAGRRIGVSAGFLGDVVKSKRFPGPKVCAFLGFIEVRAQPMYAPRRYKKESK